jgi:hypothetical protein
MSEQKSVYKQISLEQEIDQVQGKELSEPWKGQIQKARFWMAGYLAFGLLLLFGLTICCSGSVITSLVVTNAVTNALNKTSSNPQGGITQMTDFVVTLLPYVATPLGIALGYFFKGSSEE